MSSSPNPYVGPRPFNPYVGPRPFERQDKDKFFGRDHEAQELLSLIIAHRTLVFYAPSGAGKTSLLNAQVIPFLEDEGFELLPQVRVQGPPIPGLNTKNITNIYTFYTLLSWLSDEAGPAQLETDKDALATAQQLSQQTIADFLQHRPHQTDRYGLTKPRILIFDQFEELFTAYPQHWRQRETFFHQLNHALNADPLLHIVFSLREDYVAQLDPYAVHLPRNLRYRFRLERMRPANATAAVNGPLRHTNRAFAPGVAEQLTNDLRQLRVETIRGTQIVTGEYIEPVQLQVVCQNLWADLPPDVTTITTQHLQTFGNVNQALARFYERGITTIAQKQDLKQDILRDWFEQELITPASTRGLVYQGPDTTGELPNPAVSALEDFHLIRGEWRAGARWYELTHDRLVEPILHANQTYRDEKFQQRLRLIASMAGGLIAILFTLTLILGWLNQDDSNINNTNMSTIQALAITATADTSTRAAEYIALTATNEAQQIKLTATAQAQQAEATTAANTRTAEYIALTAEANVQATQQAYLQATRTTLENSLRTASAAAERINRVRPLRPGLSIGTVTGSPGTLGAFVRDQQGTNYLLTLSAIIQGSGNADGRVYQPSFADGATGQDFIGIYSRASNFIAIATLTEDISFTPSIPGIPPIYGVRAPRIGDQISIMGRTSGFASSQIDNIDLQMVMSLNAAGQGETLTNAFTAPLFTTDGDKGALVIADDGYAIGLVVGNNRDKTVMVGLNPTLDRLGVTLLQQNNALPPWPQQYGITAWNMAANQQMIATGHRGGLVNLWSAEYNQNIPEQTITFDATAITAVAVDHNSRWVIASNQINQIWLWDAQSPEFADLLYATTTPATAITFSPDNRWLVVGTEDGQLYLSSTSNLTAPPTRLNSQQQDTITALRFDTNSQWLAVATNTGLIELFNTDDWSVSTLLTGHSAAISALAFAPTNQTLYSASQDGTIRHWPLKTIGTPNALTSLDNNPILYEHTIPLQALAIDPQLNYIAFSDLKEGAYLLNLDTKTTIPLLDANTILYNFDFNDSGEWLFGRGQNQTIQIWQIR
ncbi:MAG TPA: hypothetical protein VLL52_16465 [Anaerolineae bacterium]|nr:hypothetical protein [Anaerolineae bacterium]